MTNEPVSLHQNFTRSRVSWPPKGLYIYYLHCYTPSFFFSFNSVEIFRTVKTQSCNTYFAYSWKKKLEKHRSSTFLQVQLAKTRNGNHSLVFRETSPDWRVLGQSQIVKVCRLVLAFALCKTDV